jgi:dTDP-4-dehydrorhamnose 3,5-epimerase/CDP-3, 6-dideoxy-D-glycero-D-glycero-4-hexulose-5-epimerase
MEIESTFIEGLKLIHLKEFKDDRGSFIKVFNQEFFEESGLATDFKESYYSISKKNVIRGMHFQIPPAAHTKLVYVNHGSIVDVILDIRKTSLTYGQYFKVEINSKITSVLVYIPIGCAHGFISLEDNTMVTYMQTSCYNNTCDKGIKYSSFGMNWDIEEVIVSDRDNAFVNFNDFNSPF